MGASADVDTGAILKKKEGVYLEESSSSEFAHAVLLMDELAAITDAAEKAGLRSILLKGAAMHIVGYDPVSPRKMSDVDLLVTSDDYDAWKALLTSYGFTPLPFSTSSFIKQRHFPLIFDLHKKLRFITDDLLDTAWKNSCKMEVDGVAYELLSVEIDLLYRCLHMTITHGYANKKWMDDLDVILHTHKDTIDWDILIDYTRQCHATAPMAATLGFLRECSDTPIPATILTMLESKSRTSIRSLFKFTLNRKTGLPFFDYIAPLLLQPSYIRIGKLVVGKVFPPCDVMKQRYHTTSTLLVIAVYPLRLLTLAGKGGGAFIHAVKSLLGACPPR